LAKYFKENNIDPADPFPGFWRMGLVLLCGLASFYGAYGQISTSLGFVFRAVCSVIFGVMQALPLLHVMHDCSHCAFGHSPTWWAVAGRFFMDFYAGEQA
jgi:fatty acid desaturase